MSEQVSKNRKSRLHILVSHSIQVVPGRKWPCTFHSWRLVLWDMVVMVIVVSEESGGVSV